MLDNFHRNRILNHWVSLLLDPSINPHAPSLHSSNHNRITKDIIPLHGNSQLGGLDRRFFKRYLL